MKIYKMFFNEKKDGSYYLEYAITLDKINHMLFQHEMNT